jgi:hypothetical protein
LPQIIPEQTVEEVGAAINRTLMRHHGKLDQLLAGDIIRSVVDALEVSEGRTICPIMPGVTPNSEIVLLQTADSQRYLAMLQATAAVNQIYCSRHNISYSQFVGIKRGFHPWQACFNRIVLIKEMIAAGYRGWVLYLDADAFVVDLAFDVRRLIADIAKPVIMARGGVTGQQWDVNNGVFLIDLGHEAARELILAWHADFMTMPIETLKAMVDWPEKDKDTDQPRLHRLLQGSERLKSYLGIVPRTLLNDLRGKFVRQILRAHAPTWEERLARIRRETAEVIAAADGR